MPFRVSLVLLVLLLLFAPSCGSQSLTTPEDLPITTYGTGKPFMLSFVMSSCRDPCSMYDTPRCSVSFDQKERLIEVDISLDYSRQEDNCSNVCGGQVLAHCQIEGLDSGTYTVKSGSFERKITIR